MIEPELLGVLQGILSELEDTGHSLDVDEFFDAAYRLYDSLAPPQRKLLFNPSKPKTQQHSNPQLFSRPQLDAKSVKIATANRPRNEDVAAILYRKKREYDQRINERKQEKENMELLGCTFHPNILQSPMSTSSGFKAGSRPQGSLVGSR